MCTGRGALGEVLSTEGGRAVLATQGQGTVLALPLHVHIQQRLWCGTHTTVPGAQEAVAAAAGRQAQGP